MRIYPSPLTRFRFIGAGHRQPTIPYKETQETETLDSGADGVRTRINTLTLAKQ